MINNAVFVFGIVLCWISSYPSDSFLVVRKPHKVISRYPQAINNKVPSDYNSSSRTQSPRRKKTVVDRTQAEVVSLFKDIIQAMIDVGPRAAPARTFQAYLAVSRTVQDFLPQTITSSSSTKPETFSTPLALRKFFERLGATYIKLVRNSYSL